MPSTSDTAPAPKPPEPTGEHPITAGELKHVVKIHDARVLLGMVISIIGATVGAWLLLQNEARAQARVVTQEVVVRLDRLEQIHREHLEDSRRIHAEFHSEVKEVQLDVREIYRSMTTGRPSPRLEQPLKEKP